jgi:hypothetical protein
MHNPFAIAVQWPDEPGRYLVHLQRPYFTAAIFETDAAAWLAVSWAAQSEDVGSSSVFFAAADFCRRQLAQHDLPIEFIERKHGHHLPRFLMAQTASKALFIVEPDHSAPLVEVHESMESSIAKSTHPKLSGRFDVITQWRLGQMRKYYQHFLERQQKMATMGGATTSICANEKK